MKVTVKPIKGRDGYYASRDGRIFSKWVNKGLHGLVKEEEMKELKGSLSSGRYKMVRFGRESNWHSFHRIIYTTFVGEIEEGNVIRHLNDNPLDNRVENLKQGTQKENMEDAIKNNKLKFGEENPNSKLTISDVRTIRNIKNGNPKTPNKVIAERFSVSRRTVDRIIKKETWREII